MGGQCTTPRVWLQNQIDSVTVNRSAYYITGPTAYGSHGESSRDLPDRRRSVVPEEAPQSIELMGAEHP